MPMQIIGGGEDKVSGKLITGQPVVVYWSYVNPAADPKKQNWYDDNFLMYGGGMYNGSSCSLVASDLNHAM